jgi:hypothetical protein
LLLHGASLDQRASYLTQRYWHLTSYSYLPMPTTILDATLHVAGAQVSCTATTHGFDRRTDYVGRPSSGVRADSIDVTLTGEAAFLPLWDDLGINDFRRESGHLAWHTNHGQTVRRLTFYDAHCTRLSLRFDARGQDGKESVELTLRFSPAAIELDGTYVELYSRLWWEPNAHVRRRAFIRPGPVLPPLPSVALAALKQAAQSLGKVAGAALGTVALVLTPANDADAPGYDAEKNFTKDHPTLPPDPDALRLAELARAREVGTLTPDEEAEYLALLAKVRGIRVASLADLNVLGHYKKQPQGLPGFHFEAITYTKRSKVDTDVLRRKFDSSVRAKFMKKISTEPSYMAELRAAGFDHEDLVLMQLGRVPEGWQVHHKLPLDDGGDNSLANLMLIENRPWHSVVTGHQKTWTGKLKPGESTQVKWPIYNHGIVYPPKKP